MANSTQEEINLVGESHGKVQENTDLHIPGETNIQFITRSS
jgi:hypothetical protein